MLQRTAASPTKAVFKPRVQLTSPVRLASLSHRLEEPIGRRSRSITSSTRMTKARSTLGSSTKQPLVRFQKNPITYLQRTLLGVFPNAAILSHGTNNNSATSSLIANTYHQNHSSAATIKPYHSTVTVRFSQPQSPYPNSSSQTNVRYGSSHKYKRGATSTATSK